MPTKLPHYVLPFFPAIALLTACALQQSRPEPGREGLLKKFPRWLGSGMRHLDRFSGFNYSKGKKITLDLYANP